MTIRGAVHNRRAALALAEQGQHEEAFAAAMTALDELIVSVEQAWIAINTINAERSMASTAAEGRL